MSKKSFIYARAWFLAIGISCTVIIAVSLWRSDMSPVLILDGFLVGTSLLGFVTGGIFERQATLIDGLLAMNRDLIGRNQALVELNRTIVGGLSPEAPASAPSKPSMH